jgi:hypothetical protein
MKKIKQFIQGNLNMLSDQLFGKPLYYKEQILYRASKCQDCYEQEPPRCKKCNCKLPGKHYVVESCNPDRFPDLMNEDDWNKFKKENEIEITINDE